MIISELHITRYVMRYLSLLIVMFNIIAVQSEGIESIKDKNEMRYSQYRHISKYLETLNDADISTLLKQETILHSGTGGTSVKLEIDGIPIFVKKVPLNEVEGKLENIRSTENLFGLPLYYQYGVGSAGFSAWREVSAHHMSTEWVLAGENYNFPLMYHWRILNNSQEKDPLDEEKLKNYITYWDNSSAIGERYRANHHASAHIALFIEYLPETLHSWLNKQFSKGNNAVDKAIEMVEQNLKETTAFINAKGMLHFDAHFRNILTDGEQLYFSDFGLATSSQFALSEEENKFFQIHQNYDRCYISTALTNWIISKVFGEDRFDEVLQDYALGRTPLIFPEILTPLLSSIVKHYAPITLKMNIFFETLRNKTKQAPYPADELDQLWTEPVLSF